jgi:hypothetical protein
MARYIEVTAADGTIARTRIDPTVNRFSVRPGDAFRIIDDNGNVPPGLVVKRYDNHLVISGIDEAGQSAAAQVELLDFYGVCSVANPCQVEVKEAQGSTAPVVVTSSTEPIAAVADGSFVLYDPNRPSIDAGPTAAPAETSEWSTSALVWAGVGAGIVALALAGGGGGGGGTPAAVSPSPPAPDPAPSPGPAAPPPPPGVPPDTVAPNPPVISQIGGDGRVTLAEKAAGLTIAGTGEAGAIVTVAIDGVARNSVVDNSGNWQVRFEPAQIGNDGAHSAVVTLTDAAGNRSTPTGQSYEVQTLSQILQVGGDGPPNTVNAAERAAGFTVQGLGPEGSPAGTAVTVTLSGGAGSASRTVATGVGGNWVATFVPSDNLPDGSYTVNAFGTIGGVAGTAATRSALIDATPPGAPAIAPVGGDNVLFPSEIAGGVVISGRAEPGSSVAVAINNVPLAVGIEGDGDWTAAVPGQLLQSAGPRQVTAAATDAVGNSGPQAQVVFLVTALSAAGEGDSRLTTQALQAEQLFSDPGPGSTGVTAVASALPSTAPASPLSTLIDDPNQANLA